LFSIWAITLALTPALVELGGQVGYFLWLIWIVAATVPLARGARTPAVNVASRENNG
jgi:hypothetical protein